jgi:hypothetical protein
MITLHLKVKDNTNTILVRSKITKNYSVFCAKENISISKTNLKNLIEYKIWKKQNAKLSLTPLPGHLQFCNNTTITETYEFIAYLMHTPFNGIYQTDILLNLLVPYKKLIFADNGSLND